MALAGPGWTGGLFLDRRLPLIPIRHVVYCKDCVIENNIWYPQASWVREIRAFQKAVSYFMVEGDSLVLSVGTVGIMLPLSEVKRTESGSVAEVAHDPEEAFE